MSLQERAGRTLMWFGHYELLFLFLLVINGIVSNVLPRDQAATGVATILVLPLLITAVMSDVALHEHRLCERCIRAAPVLNPAGAVRRWRPFLWFFHRTAVILLLLLASLGWFCSALWLAHPPLWARAGSIAALCVLMCVTFTQHRHRKLMPWCPWCRWGGGGGQDVPAGMPETPASR